MRCPSGRTESSAPTTGQGAVRNGTSYPKGICSAALHCGTPSPTGGFPHPSVGRDLCVPPHDMHVFLPAGHAGPALQGTGRVRADRVVRPYSGSRSRAKRDVVPQGHLFRYAPLQDAVPYTRLSTAHRSPVKAMDFASCRWQTDDGVPCVRQADATKSRRARRAFTSWGACALISLYLPPDTCWRRGSGRRSCSRPCRGRGAG